MVTVFSHVLCPGEDNSPTEHVRREVWGASCNHGRTNSVRWQAIAAMPSSKPKRGAEPVTCFEMRGHHRSRCLKTMGQSRPRHCQICLSAKLHSKPSSKNYSRTTMGSTALASCKARTADIIFGSGKDWIDAGVKSSACSASSGTVTGCEWKRHLLQ